MNTPSNIVGCYGALVGLLGVQGAREVCVKNPAVLGNNPSSLAGCSAQEVRDASPTPNLPRGPILTLTLTLTLTPALAL